MANAKNTKLLKIKKSIKQKPYYETKHGIIYNADCFKIMKQIPKKSVTLTFTSPPYNTGGMSIGLKDKFYNDYEDNLKDEDYYKFIHKNIKQSIRISTHAFWNMQMLTGNKTTIIELLYAFRMNLKDVSIWKKNAVPQIQKGDMPKRTAKGFEFIFMFGADNSMSFKDNNFRDNNFVPNVIDVCQSKRETKEHNAIFPTEVARHFIDNFSKPNDVVLDCFFGSGTTAVSCERRGRKWIGIELDEHYCEVAAKRIEKVYKETKMINPYDAGENKACFKSGQQKTFDD